MFKLPNCDTILKYFCYSKQDSEVKTLQEELETLRKSLDQKNLDHAASVGKLSKSVEQNQAQLMQHLQSGKQWYYSFWIFPSFRDFIAHSKICLPKFSEILLFFSLFWFILTQFLIALRLFRIFQKFLITSLGKREGCKDIKVLGWVTPIILHVQIR